MALASWQELRFAVACCCHRAFFPSASPASGSSCSGNLVPIAGQVQLVSVLCHLCLCSVVCVHPLLCHRALFRLGALSASFWAVAAAGVSTRLLSRIGLIPASLQFCFWRPEEVHKMFSSIFLLTFGSIFFSWAMDFSMKCIGPSSLW